MVFSNILSFKKAFQNLPKGKNIIIDISEAKIIDHSSILALNTMADEYKREGGQAQPKGRDKRGLSGDRGVPI